MPGHEQAVIDGLTIVAPQGEALLHDASLRLASGQIVGLVGPSGAGKTTLLRSMLGCLPPGASRTSGSVRVREQEVLDLRDRQLQDFRHRHLAFVAQDAGACLNPTMKVRSLLKEAARRNQAADIAKALDQVQLAERFLRRRPGELSGGEQRRVALARALVRGVDILLIDEPLASLHGPLRRQIIGVLRRLVEDGTVAIAVTCHQAALVTDLADSVVRVDTNGSSPQVGPTRDTPRRLPGPERPARSDAAAPALVGRQIVARAGPTEILHGIDLVARQGLVTALMGASGAGKTTIARVLSGLHRDASGTLELAGRPMPVAATKRAGADQRRVQYVPQDPLSTLNPSKTVGATIQRPMRRRDDIAPDQIVRRTHELLETIGLTASFERRYPHELSGGQRQRVAIARALAAGPDVMVCDEITSALDARTAASIMAVLDQAVAETGLTLVLVSHELEEIRRHSDFVYVIADGRVAESGPTAKVLDTPTSDEARALLA